MLIYLAGSLRGAEDDGGGESKCEGIGGCPEVTLCALRGNFAAIVCGRYCVRAAVPNFFSKQADEMGEYEAVVQLLCRL